MDEKFYLFRVPRMLYGGHRMVCQDVKLVTILHTRLDLQYNKWYVQAAYPSTRPIADLLYLALLGRWRLRLYRVLTVLL